MIYNNLCPSCFKKETDGVYIKERIILTPLDYKDKHTDMIKVCIHPGGSIYDLGLKGDKVVFVCSPEQQVGVLRTRDIIKEI